MAEITIRGAGIFGLSVAWACVQRSATVQVIDPNGPAAGSSGGIVGALAGRALFRHKIRKSSFTAKLGGGVLLNLGIVGGLFVVEALSVIVQVLYFKRTGKRVFLMAPIHHHFEKKGWAEPQIVIRFWIISLILAMIGLATLKVR